MKEIHLKTYGIGIIMYSPWAVRGIKEGENYFERNYSESNQVLNHIFSGSIPSCIVGSGFFNLKIQNGYPSQEILERYPYATRLFINVRGDKIIFRCVTDLELWSRDHPVSQEVQVRDGIYHITLCGSMDYSQENEIQILTYLQPLDTTPKLNYHSIPALFP